MVRKIPPDVEDAVLRYWLGGDNYREISHKTLISVGKVSGIINRKRTAAPDLDELRKFLLSIKAQKSSYIDLLRGQKFLERLDQLGVSLGQLDACVKLLNQYGKEAGNILALLDRLRRLEATSGRTYQQIVDDSFEKAKRLEESEKRIRELKAREEDIRAHLPELERLRVLVLKMQDNQVTILNLDGFIDQSRRLSQLGFTLSTAEILATELSKAGLEPNKAAAILADAINQYQELENALRILREEKRLTEQAVEDAKIKLISLNKQVANQTILIEENRSLSEKLEETYEKMRKQLDLDYLGTITSKTAEIEGLKKGKDKLEGEISVLNMNMTAAKNEAGKIMEKVVHIRKLNLLSCLLKDPKVEYDLREVLELANTFVNSIYLNLENHTNYPGYFTTRDKIRDLNSSLLGWLKVASES
jgi:hypothetical protein